MIYNLSIQYPNQIIIKLILHIKIYQYLQETERLCKISLGKWNISIRISNINNMIIIQSSAAKTADYLGCCISVDRQIKTCKFKLSY